MHVRKLNMGLIGWEVGSAERVGWRRKNKVQKHGKYFMVPATLSSELKNERVYMTDFLSHRRDKGLWLSTHICCWWSEFITGSHGIGSLSNGSLFLKFPETGIYRTVVEWVSGEDLLPGLQMYSVVSEGRENRTHPASNGTNPIGRTPPSWA